MALAPQIRLYPGPKLASTTKKLWRRHCDAGQRHCHRPAIGGVGPFGSSVPLWRLCSWHIALHASEPASLLPESRSESYLSYHRGWPGPRRMGFRVSWSVCGWVWKYRTRTEHQQQRRMPRQRRACTRICRLIAARPIGGGKIEGGGRAPLWSRSIILRYLTETLLADNLHTSETKGG